MFSVYYLQIGEVYFYNGINTGNSSGKTIQVVNNSGTTSVNLKDQKEYFSHELGSPIKSTDEEKKLSLERCRKILKQSGNKYTDEEILKIRKLLYKLGNLEYHLFTELKTKQHDKRNPLRTGINGRTGS